MKPLITSSEALLIPYMVTDRVEDVLRATVECACADNRGLAADLDAFVKRLEDQGRATMRWIGDEETYCFLEVGVRVIGSFLLLQGAPPKSRGRDGCRKGKGA